MIKDEVIHARLGMDAVDHDCVVWGNSCVIHIGHETNRHTQRNSISTYEIKRAVWGAVVTYSHGRMTKVRVVLTKHKGVCG